MLKWLPIGSVIDLNGKDVVIISRGFIVPQNETFVYYDYCGIDANESIQISPTYLFNNDNVKMVVFTGWDSKSQNDLEKRFFVNVVSKGVKKAKKVFEDVDKRLF